MADPVGAGGGQRHLDASGPREVVYCHQCDNEWWQDEYGLVCPSCESEITEIITPESDPRPIREPPPTPPDIHSLRDHTPWGDADSDPEEADIEEHVTHGPGGSVLFSRTIRSSNRYAGRSGSRRRPQMPEDDPDYLMRDIHSLLGNIMGPGFRPGQPGRSGPETLFTQGPFNSSGFRLGGNGGPHFMGGRVTISTGGRLRPRDVDGPQPAGPPIDDLATVLGGLFTAMGQGQPGQPRDDGSNGLPPQLRALFSAMLNPANARSGDAVYTQEALDQIISTLMEQHPTSNAPGPAAPDAIAALPKKKLDEKALGPEGKGECSVCMDDVHIGDEVVFLPCNHWFHETCAGAWLGEHNTCPICRKGIDAENSSNNARPSQNTTSTPRNEYRSRRSSTGRPFFSRDDTTPTRNEARLDAIRNTGRVPQEESAGRRSPDRGTTDDEPIGQIPGAFTSYRHPDSNQNSTDSRRESYTSSSERSREPRRSSNSGGAGGGSGGGAMSWIRDRLGSRRND